MKYSVYIKFYFRKILFYSTQSVLSNHLPKVSQQKTESVITSSMMTPPPSSAGTSVISGQESPRSNMFHNSPYTTPTKKDPNSLQQNKVNVSISCTSLSLKL